MRKLLLLAMLLPLFAGAQNRKKKDYLVTLTTNFGVMRFILHDETPKHKANFIRLVD